MHIAISTSPKTRSFWWWADYAYYQTPMYPRICSREMIELGKALISKHNSKYHLESLNNCLKLYSPSATPFWMIKISIEATEFPAQSKGEYRARATPQGPKDPPAFG
jgi:hypothetical protein